jgi:hypothetical protein
MFAGQQFEEDNNDPSKHRCIDVVSCLREMNVVVDGIAGEVEVAVAV